MRRTHTERPADRTLRVWRDVRDVTDGDPASWGWPYSDWYADGWRPAEGPNSGGYIPGGRAGTPLHSTDDFHR